MAVPGDVLLALSVLGLAILFALLGGGFWLLWLHVRLRRAGMEAERALLARALPSDADLPDVCVQLPVFNEGAIVQRAVRSAAGLDWPRGKLHIQVLDDSTDDTAEYARAAAAEFPGLDIQVLHREDRAGFKAGALAAGMAALPRCQYFAILDADYMPAPDFLRLTMRPLLFEPKLAFAQARFDYLNAEANELTRVQALMLDGHLGVEQATRSWAGHPLPFNGTCGIWRRAAVEAAGGWRGDTLAEDLDLSYRAWLAGWRGTFLVSVAVPGELPDERRAWVAQQRRWAKGSGEVARRMAHVLRGAWRFGPTGFFGALLHLGQWWSTPILVLTALVAVAAGIIHPSAGPSLAVAGIVLALGAEVQAFLYWRLGNRLLRMPPLSWPRLIGRGLMLQTLGARLLLRNITGIVEAIFARQSVFQRTPKRGVSGPGQ